MSMIEPVPVVAGLAVALAIALGCILWLMRDAKRQSATRARDEDLRKAMQEERWLR